VDEASAMRGIDGIGDLLADTAQLCERDRTRADSIREGLAFQILHDQEINAVSRIQVVKRADVGMLQLGNRFRLTLEALAIVPILSKVIWQELDRDVSTEPRVAGPIHLSHTALAEQRNDLETTQVCAGL